VQAQDPSLNIFASGSTALSANALVGSVNITLPPTGTVQGRAVATDGGTGLTNGDITVQSFTSSGPLGIFESFSNADLAGNYLIAGVPLGGVRSIAADSTNTNSVGLTDGALTSTGPAVLDIQLGNAIRIADAFNLDGTDGFRYDIGCDGGLISGGTVDGRLYGSYFGAGAYLANFNSVVQFPCISIAARDLGGRELILGPVSTASLTVQRRVFVPSAGKFARILDSVSNSSTVSIPMNIRVGLTTEATRLLADPAQNGNTYAIFDNDGACCVPVVGTVIGGGSTAATLASNVSATPGDTGSSLSYSWQMTIPPGQTITFMHFSVQRDFTDTSGASAQVLSLVNSSDPDMLAGMSDADKSQVQNFTLQ
jgi:hypothetical protein